MLFSTFDFLLFALPVIVGFWALSGRPIARSAFLIAASYFFYMAGPKTEPPPAPWYFARLLLLSTSLDFVCGRKIQAIANSDAMLVYDLEMNTLRRNRLTGMVRSWHDRRIDYYRVRHKDGDRDREV